MAVIKKNKKDKQLLWVDKNKISVENEKNDYKQTLNPHTYTGIR